MFVLEALTLTFMTTPLVTLLYPLERRTRATADGINFNNIAADSKVSSSPPGEKDSNYLKSRFTVVLDKIDHSPGMMALTQLLHAPVDAVARSPGVFVEALRLIELSDRTSAVMKSSVADTLLHTDPLLAIFRTFGELHELPVSTSLSVVPYDDLAYSVADHARTSASQLILVPWLPPSVSDPSDVTANQNEGATTPKATTAQMTNPFDALFRSTSKEKSLHAIHSQFVCGVFSQSKADVALFIDQGHAPGAINAQHIFLPFFGGPDDRLALKFVVQLCANPKISATVVRITKMDSTEIGPAEPVHLGGEPITQAGVNNMLSVTSVSVALEV